MDEEPDRNLRMSGTRLGSVSTTDAIIPEPMLSIPEVPDVVEEFRPPTAPSSSSDPEAAASSLWLVRRHRVCSTKTQDRTDTMGADMMASMRCTTAVGPSGTVGTRVALKARGAWSSWLPEVELWLMVSQSCRTESRLTRP